MQLLTYTTSRFYFTPARNTLCRRFCQAGNDQDLKECAFGGGSGVLPPASCFVNLITSTYISSFKVWQPKKRVGLEPTSGIRLRIIAPIATYSMSSVYIHHRNKIHYSFLNESPVLLRCDLIIFLKSGGFSV
jgi:hypothetical protein